MAGAVFDVVLTLGQKPGVVSSPDPGDPDRPGWAVRFVVKGDQTVEMRPVVIGESVGGLVEVQQGVQSGEKVVTEGHIRLASGSRVKVQL